MIARAFFNDVETARRAVDQIIRADVVADHPRGIAVETWKLPTWDAAETAVEWLRDLGAIATEIAL
jgi:hypothetical protein